MGSDGKECYEKLSLVKSDLLTKIIKSGINLLVE